jgi:predicted nucleotide-binding protein
MSRPSPRRPNIFVASSQEALPVARAVKQNFDNEADVDIWDENIFNPNRSYLETLLNRASYYDFVTLAVDGLA